MNNRHWDSLLVLFFMMGFIPTLEYAIVQSIVNHHNTWFIAVLGLIQIMILIYFVIRKTK